MNELIWTPEEREVIQAQCDEVAGKIVWCEEVPANIAAGYPEQFRAEVFAADPEIGITLVYKNWNARHDRPCRCVQQRRTAGSENFRQAMRRTLQECQDGWVPLGEKAPRGPNITCPFT